MAISLQSTKIKNISLGNVDIKRISLGGVEVFRAILQLIFNLTSWSSGRINPITGAIESSSNSCNTDFHSIPEGVTTFVYTSNKGSDQTNDAIIYYNNSATPIKWNYAIRNDTYTIPKGTTRIRLNSATGNTSIAASYNITLTFE